MLRVQSFVAESSKVLAVPILVYGPCHLLSAHLVCFLLGAYMFQMAKKIRLFKHLAMIVVLVDRIDL